MKVTEFFTAKAVMGIGLAFVQALIFMAIVGGFTDQPLLMLTTLFLGGILVTGTGFLVASVAKDMMSVMAWGVLAVLLFAIPGFNVLFPGSGSEWARIIPSYYLTDTVNQVSNYGAGWGDMAGNLLALLGFNAVILTGGVMALRRKFR
jgi:phosphoglycerol transferase MdoB-like AlkP superfamily enzyme